MPHHVKCPRPTPVFLASRGVEIFISSQDPKSISFEVATGILGCDWWRLATEKGDVSEPERLGPNGCVSPLTDPNTASREVNRPQ